MIDAELPSRSVSASGVITGGRLVSVEPAAVEPAERDRLGPPVDIHVRDGVVEEIRPARGRTGTVDAAGLALLPGMINGHTHSHETFYRGRYPKTRLEQWMLHVRPPISLDLSPDDIYLRTALTAIEAVHGGATVVVDDVGLPDLPSAHLDAVLRAYADVGVRAIVAPTMFDLTFADSVPFVADELSREARAAFAAATGDPAGTLDRLRQRLIHQSSQPRGQVEIAVAASAPQRCSDDFIVALFELAGVADVPIFSHLNETRAQAATAQLIFGETMTAHLSGLGLLSDRLTAIHGIWLTGDDVRMLAASGVTVQCNPLSNGRLGSGVAGVAGLRRAGVRVSLGTDGLGSTVTMSMVSAVREAALMSTAHPDAADWVDVRDAFAMATVEGARAIDAPHLGLLTPGQGADLIGLSLDHYTLNPLNDPLRQIVYGGAPVELSVVAGGPVMEGGRLTRVDEKALLAQAAAVHRRIRPRMAAADAWLAEHAAGPVTGALAQLDRTPVPEMAFATVLR